MARAPAMRGEGYNFDCERSAGDLDAIEFDPIGLPFDFRG
jgi:hypothetical protein